MIPAGILASSSVATPAPEMDPAYQFARSVLTASNTWSFEQTLDVPGEPATLVIIGASTPEYIPFTVGVNGTSATILAAEQHVGDHYVWMASTPWPQSQVTIGAFFAGEVTGAVAAYLIPATYSYVRDADFGTAPVGDTGVIYLSSSSTVGKKGIILAAAVGLWPQFGDLINPEPPEGYAPIEPGPVSAAQRLGVQHYIVPAEAASQYVMMQGDSTQPRSLLVLQFTHDPQV